MFDAISVDRRTLIAGGLAAWATAASAADKAKPFFQKHGLPIGIQLYALGPDNKKDLAASFKTIAGIGYRAVEMGLDPSRPAASVRKMLDDAGLACTAVHSNFTDAEGLGGDSSKLADMLHILGAKTVASPFVFLPKRLDQQPAQGEDLFAWLSRILAQFTVDDWKMNAELLNRKGAELAKFGIRMAYHNHNFELAPVGNTTGLEILLNDTDPSNVTFEVDIGWVAASGRDPVALFRKYPGRFSLAHVKDFKAGMKPTYAMRMDPAEVGSGAIDWKRVLPAAYAAGVREYYVEQEPPYARPPADSARISYDYLSRLVA